MQSLELPGAYGIAYTHSATGGNTYRYNMFSNGGLYTTYVCETATTVSDFTDNGPVTCSFDSHQGIGSFEGASETELMTTKDSKIIIGIVVSIILTIFCAAVMFILYRKNIKESNDYDLEIFYSAATTTNSLETLHYTNKHTNTVQVSE